MQHNHVQINLHSNLNHKIQRSLHAKLAFEIKSHKNVPYEQLEFPEFDSSAGKV